MQTGNDPVCGVEWRNGFTGLVLLVIVPVAIWLLLAGFDESFVPAEREAYARNGKLLVKLASARWNGISLPLLGLFVALAWEIRRSVQRFRDPFAIRASDISVAFHRQIRRDPIAWGNIDKVRLHQSGLKSEISIWPKEAPPVQIKNVDQEMAAAFAEAARSRGVTVG